MDGTPGPAASSSKRHFDYYVEMKTSSLPSRRGHKTNQGHIYQGYEASIGNIASNIEGTPISGRRVSAEGSTVSGGFTRQNSSSAESVREEKGSLDDLETSQSSHSDDMLFRKRTYQHSPFSSMMRPREDKPMHQRLLLAGEVRRGSSSSDESNPGHMVGVSRKTVQSTIVQSLQEMNLPEWFDERYIPLHGKPSVSMSKLKLILEKRDSIENYKKLTDISDSEQNKYFDFFDSLSNNFTLADKYLEKMNIPRCQIILCGTQSAGKSSLMAAWTGIKTTICIGTGTKTAIIYQFSKAEKFESEVNFEGESRIKKFETLSDLNNHLCAIQESIVGKISPKVLIVKVRAPHCSRITFVDLPGDVGLDKKEEDKITRHNMFKRFLTPHNILLRVMPEGLDKDSDGIFQQLINSDTLSRNLIIVTTKVKEGLESFVTGHSDKGDDRWLNGLFSRGFYKSDRVSIPVFGVDINSEVVSEIADMSSSGKSLSDIWDRNDNQLYETIRDRFSTMEKFSEDKRKIAIGHPACLGMEASLRAVKWLAADINKQNYENIIYSIKTTLLPEIRNEIQVSKKVYFNECFNINEFHIGLDSDAFYEKFRKLERFVNLELKVRGICNFRSGPFYHSKDKGEEYNKSLNEFCKSEMLKKNNGELCTGRAGSSSDSIRAKESKGDKLKSCEDELVDSQLAERGHYEVQKLKTSAINFISMVMDAYNESASQGKSTYREDSEYIANEGLALQALSQIVWEEMADSCHELKKALVVMLQGYIYNLIDNQITGIFNLNKSQIDSLKEYVTEGVIESIDASYLKQVCTEPHLSVPSIGDKEIRFYGLFFSSLGIEVNESSIRSHLDKLKKMIIDNKHKAVVGTKIAAATLAIGGTTAAVVASAGPLLGILGVGAAITSIFVPSLTHHALSALSSGAKKIGSGVNFAVLSLKSAHKKDKVHQEKLKQQVADYNNKGNQELTKMQASMKTSLNLLSFFATAESIVDNTQFEFYDRITDQVFKQCIKDSVSIMRLGLVKIKCDEVADFDDNEHSNLFKARTLKETEKQLKALVGV